MDVVRLMIAGNDLRAEDVVSLATSCSQGLQLLTDGPLWEDMYRRDFRAPLPSGRVEEPVGGVPGWPRAYREAAGPPPGAWGSRAVGGRRAVEHPRGVPLTVALSALQNAPATSCVGVGTSLLVGMADGYFRVWDGVRDARGAPPPATRSAHFGSGVTGLCAWGPLAVSCGGDGTVAMWHVEGGPPLLEVCRILRPQEGPVTAQANAVAADGGWTGALADAGDDGRIALYDGAEGRSCGVLDGHESSVMRLDFGHGLLASTSLDGTVRVWDVRQRAAVRVLSLQVRSGRAASVRGGGSGPGDHAGPEERGSDGGAEAGGSGPGDGGARQEGGAGDVGGGGSADPAWRPPLGVEDFVRLSVLASEHDRLAVRAGAGAMHTLAAGLSQLRGGRPGGRAPAAGTGPGPVAARLPPALGPEDAAASTSDRCASLGVAWHPSRGALFSSHGDGGVRSWDLRTWRCVSCMAGDTRWAEALVVPRGAPRTLAAAGADGTVRFYSTESLRLRGATPAHDCPVSALCELDLGAGGVGVASVDVRGRVEVHVPGQAGAPGGDGGPAPFQRTVVYRNPPSRDAVHGQGPARAESGSAHFRALANKYSSWRRGHRSYY